MELNALISILDESDLTREVVTLRDGTGISYLNNTGDSLTATVNGDDYDDLLKICLVPYSDTVKVYINSIARFKFDSIGLGSVSTFSIS